MMLIRPVRVPPAALQPPHTGARFLVVRLDFMRFQTPPYGERFGHVGRQAKPIGDCGQSQTFPDWGQFQFTYTPNRNRRHCPYFIF